MALKAFPLFLLVCRNAGKAMRSPGGETHDFLTFALFYL